MHSRDSRNTKKMGRYLFKWKWGRAAAADKFYSTMMEWNFSLGRLFPAACGEVSVGTWQRRFAHKHMHTRYHTQTQRNGLDFDTDRDGERD